MAAARSSVTLVPIYQNTLRHLQKQVLVLMGNEISLTALIGLRKEHGKESEVPTKNV
jgi:hypothetical protein